MSITYDARDLLNKLASKGKVEKLVTQRLTLNKAALSVIEGGADFLSRPTLEKTALKVIKGYKQKYDQDGEPITNSDKGLLVNRVQNLVVYEVAQEIKQQYLGEYYIWLPSDAEVPDPLHQLKYGRKFQIGKGEMPGDRYGCRCGMRILVKESELEL